MSGPSRRRVLQSLGAGVGVGLAGCVDGGPSPEEEAEQHREAIASYADVASATEDGYQLSMPYLSTDAGVQGLPLVNVEAPMLEPERPNVLLYDLGADGTFELVAAKWYVSTEEADEPPSLFGRTFDGPFEGRALFVPEHYGLTAWLFEENPDGLFAEANAEVEPPAYLDDLETAWDALEQYSANVVLAERAGYANAEICYEGDGGDYGIPVVNTDASGTDPAEPSVLLYRFASNWSYHLVGAEWYVPADEVDAPPTMFGQEFHGPQASHGEESVQPEHYGLHAWLSMANPEGMFAPYNPLLECINRPENR